MAEPLFRGTIARMRPAYEVRVILTRNDEASAELTAASADGWEVKSAVATPEGIAVILQRVKRREAE